MYKDLAGKEHWDESWIDSTIPNPIDPHNQSLDNYTNRCFHEYFSKIFSGLNTQNLKLLEIGCARSAWLPYFAKEFSFQVYGIDYSEIGCQQARQILSNVALEGEIICANFFSPPKSMMGVFDVVVSFGVAEHFEDTNSCIDQFSQFLKPNGLLITIIPNLTGWLGFLQKTFNEAVYKIHIPINVKELKLSHLKANLEILDCRYFISQSIALISLKGLDKNQRKTWLKNFIQLYLSRFAKLLWFVENYVKFLPATAVLSPYIICVAQKK
jgi:2-polyprenyl-3-methyl-5-hydroxy-6-metoxy-1,4-benzoquinol methylase